MYIFVGPMFVDVRPLEITLPPTLLMQQIPYGQTVYRDSQGQWHTVYAPSLEALADADRVYAGGRTYVLTDDQRSELIAAGYGDYIQQVADPVPSPPWPLPASIGALPPVVDIAAVGTAVVGVSVLF